MGFNPAQPRAVNGTFAGGGASTGASKAPGTAAASGKQDLQAIARAHGMSEAQLVKMNPKLRSLVGSGAAVPKGTKLATSKTGEKQAAKSQAGAAKKVAAAGTRARTNTSSGKQDLQQMAKKAGVSEKKLVAMNPKLKSLEGTGKAVPKGDLVATKPHGERAAARSQAPKKTAVRPGGHKAAPAHKSPARKAPARAATARKGK